MFEAEQGDGYQGDIAIDDIKIEADVCPGERKFEKMQRLRGPFREIFSYGVRHTSLWFSEVWLYASLNHSGIYRIPYVKNGLRNLCTLAYKLYTIWQSIAFS